MEHGESQRDERRRRQRALSGRGLWTLRRSPAPPDRTRRPITMLPQTTSTASSGVLDGVLRVSCDISSSSLLRCRRLQLAAPLLEALRTNHDPRRWPPLLHQTICVLVASIGQIRSAKSPAPKTPIHTGRHRLLHHGTLSGAGCSRTRNHQLLCSELTKELPQFFNKAPSLGVQSTRSPNTPGRR